MTDKTPTPIDPTDRNAIYKVFVDAVGFGETAYTPHKGVMAVARAVLPEGYVAVPVAEIRSHYQVLFEADTTSLRNLNKRLGIEVDWLRSLLPEAGEE
jgi:hypothetical protein